MVTAFKFLHFLKKMKSNIKLDAIYKKLNLNFTKKICNLLKKLLNSKNNNNRKNKNKKKVNLKEKKQKI